MKKTYFTIAYSLVRVQITDCVMLFKQVAHSTSSMLRLFEDNDFINIHFSGSDQAYHLTQISNVPKRCS